MFRNISITLNISVTIGVSEILKNFENFEKSPLRKSAFKWLPKIIMTYGNN